MIQVSALVDLMQGGEVFLNNRGIVDQVNSCFPNSTVFFLFIFSPFFQMIQIADVQVVLLAKTLAVNLDNLLGSYSVRGKSHEGQKVLYRQADEKKVSRSLQKFQAYPKTKISNV